MNDKKSYRKWLRKTSQETDSICLIKQFYPNNDYSNCSPRIFVVIGGKDQTNVSSFLKRWRTSRVDIDSKGKPCLERMMTVVIEGYVEGLLEEENNNNNSEGDVTDTQENVAATMERIGGVEWREIVETTM